jgi:hypothetical protein
MKKIFSLILTSVLFFSLFNYALANENSSSLNSTEEYVEENEKEIRKGFDELEIDDKTQDELLEKLSRGETLDSMNPENIEKTQKSLENLSLGESTVITFEDGSKAEIGTELINSDEINTRASAGTYEVKAYWNTIILNAVYYNTVKIVSGSNNDYISKVYNESISVIGGDYSEKSLGIKRKTETSSYFAYSQLKFKYTIPTGSGTFNLYLNVGNNSWNATLSQSDVK